MSDVPFLDLGAAYRELHIQIDEAIRRVLASGWYIGGPEVERFETEYAAYCEADHCVGVGNGLDALSLVLTAMEVGPGDEVIVASNGFIATLLAVSRLGATLVLVEPDPATHNLDPVRVQAAITSRTRVVLPTHLYGQPADLDPLLEIARKHRLRLIEDAAQSHGARYKGRRIGAHGDAVTWSFYPSKNLGAMGDGGAVTTNDAEIAARVRQLGNYGSKERYINEVRGVNSRLDPMQAAILSEKLPFLDQWNGRRRAVASAYASSLAGLDGVILPSVPNWADPVWHLYVIQSDNRDELQRRMADADIQTLIHYPVPPHRQQAYADLGFGPGSFPIAERLAESVLSLPMGPHLPDEQVQQVIEAVRSSVN